MVRSSLIAASIVLISSVGVGEAFAFGIPGGKRLPGLGGGGGGTDSITSQAKVKTVNAILKQVGKSAFEGGKIIASKQKWACDKLAKAQGIVRVINKPDLEEKVSSLRSSLYCGVTDVIPAELLAPEKEKIDTQKT